jgi:hypothetical protein
MVGDGVNDAAALARPTSGLAMGTGTDVAIEASDLTLVRGDLRVAADAIRLSRRTLRVIKSNLFWAFGYNLAALPLAAAGLLNPMLAGAAWRSAPCSSWATACAFGGSGHWLRTAERAAAAICCVESFAGSHRDDSSRRPVDRATCRACQRNAHPPLDLHQRPVLARAGRRERPPIFQPLPTGTP